VVQNFKKLNCFKIIFSNYQYQNGVYCLGVKVFNMLPSYIKTEFDKPKKFKVVL